nr:MAG TPA: Protein of unknown function (DUF1492) [Caudoviricetes sp.]
MIRLWRDDDTGKITPERQKELEVREWLRGVRDKTQAVADQQDKIRRWRAAATQTTQNMTGMPGGGSGGDKIGATIARITEEEERLAQMEHDLRQRRGEAYRRILWPLGNELFYTQQMTDYLEGYYLDCKSTDSLGNFQLVTYDQLAGRKNVDPSTIKKSMQKAVKILARYWDTF